MKFKKNSSRAFTIIELILTMIVFGTIVLIFIIRFGSTKEITRNSRRIIDIKIMQTALAVYYDKEGRYPNNINELVKKEYLNVLPTNPWPRDERGCPDKDYVYTAISDTKDYTIDYCISIKVGGVTAGYYYANKDGYLNSF